MKKILPLLGVAVLWLLPSRAIATPIVSVQTPAAVGQGGSFAVDVNIAQVSDLYSFQLDLNFNPAVLQATNVFESTFLPGGGATFFIAGGIDNTTGTIAFNADTLQGPGPGVSGSGSLLEFIFTAAAQGTSALSVSNLILQDSNGNLISGLTQDGSVTVGVSGNAPEPCSLLLAGIGFLVAFVLAKRW